MSSVSGTLPFLSLDKKMLPPAEVHPAFPNTHAEDRAPKAPFETMAIPEFINNLQVLILIFTVLFGVQLVASYISYRRLSHIPGPWLASWSSLWLVGAVWRRHSHLEFYDIAKIYGEYQDYTSFLLLHQEKWLISKGSLARIGPDLLITSDPELLKRMSAARSSYTRSDWYLAFRLMPGVDNVFTMLDDKQHTKRRSQMHNGVSN
jgi:hypothetical protein